MCDGAYQAIILVLGLVACFLGYGKFYRKKTIKLSAAVWRKDLASISEVVSLDSYGMNIPAARTGRYHKLRDRGYLEKAFAFIGLKILWHEPLTEEEQNFYDKYSEAIRLVRQQNIMRN